MAISLKDQDRVFDMFYRADQKIAGIGLGLYIAKTAVQKLEGAIRLTSEPGKETSVEIRLPAKKEPAVGV